MMVYVFIWLMIVGLDTNMTSIDMVDLVDDYCRIDLVDIVDLVG